MTTKVSDSEMSSYLTLHTAQADSGSPWRPNSLQLGRASVVVNVDAESSAEALVEALDGSERKLLLSHIARAYPDVVETSVAWLAEYHEAAHKRQRTARRRREHDKRRRQSAEDRDRG